MAAFGWIGEIGLGCIFTLLFSTWATPCTVLMGWVGLAGITFVIWTIPLFVVVVLVVGTQGGMLEADMKESMIS